MLDVVELVQVVDIKVLVNWGGWRCKHRGRAMEGTSALRKRFTTFKEV